MTWHSCWHMFAGLAKAVRNLDATGPGHAIAGPAPGSRRPSG